LRDLGHSPRNSVKYRTFRPNAPHRLKVPQFAVIGGHPIQPAHTGVGRARRVAVAVMVATVAAQLMGDRSIWATLCFALCNTGEALLTAWLIERFFGAHFSLHNLRMVLGLAVLQLCALSQRNICQQRAPG
jgi:hypothetical protein